VLSARNLACQCEMNWWVPCLDMRPTAKPCGEQTTAISGAPQKKLPQWVDNSIPIMCRIPQKPSEAKL